jgi:hypothetical protein
VATRRLGHAEDYTRRSARCNCAARIEQHNSVRWLQVEPLEVEDTSLAGNAGPRLAIAWARANNSQRTDIHQKVFDERAR